MKRGKPLSRGATKTADGRRRFSSFAATRSPMKRTRMKRRAPKRLARRAGFDALGRFIRAQPCICCGRRAPSDAAHMTLSRNEKGMGMKVSDAQRVPLCRRDHRAWDTHAGRFAGWSDDQRYALAATWLAEVQLAVTPGDSRDDALALSAAGLGHIEETATGWRWVPGGEGDSGLPGQPMRTVGRGSAAAEARREALRAAGKRRGVA